MHRCHFCEEPQDKCRKLIVHNDIGICDQCVQSCQEIMNEGILSDEEPEEREPKPEAEPSSTTEGT